MTKQSSMTTRKPDPIVPGTRKLKQALKRSRGCVRGKKSIIPEGVSLKKFVSENIATFDEELQKLAAAWFANKLADPSNPPMGIGHTNGKQKNKGGGGGKQQAA